MTFQLVLWSYFLCFSLFSSLQRKHALLADSAGVTREQFPKLLKLVRLLISWPYQHGRCRFYHNMTAFVESAAQAKVMSESDGDRLSLVAQGNRCGTKAWLGFQYNSQRCFTDAIVFHSLVYVWLGGFRWRTSEIQPAVGLYCTNELISCLLSWYVILFHSGKANRNRLDVTTEALWHLAVVLPCSFTVYFMIACHFNVTRNLFRKDYKTNFLRDKDSRNDLVFTLLRFSFSKANVISPFSLQSGYSSFYQPRRAAWWLALSPWGRGGAGRGRRGLSLGAPASSHRPKTYIWGIDEPV